MTSDSHKNHFWGRSWILNKLARVGHMYSFFFYSILFEVVLSATSLVNMFFFTTSINVIFGLPLSFFTPLT